MDSSPIVELAAGRLAEMLDAVAVPALLGDELAARSYGNDVAAGYIVFYVRPEDFQLAVTTLATEIGRESLDGFPILVRSTLAGASVDEDFLLRGESRNLAGRIVRVMSPVDLESARFDQCDRYNAGPYRRARGTLGGVPGWMPPIVK